MTNIVLYRVFYGLQEIGEMAIRQGGVHTVLVSGNTKLGFEPVFSDFLLTPENSVHMLWLIPQYFVITTGEIMFSVTGLEFSYSQVSLIVKQGSNSDKKTWQSGYGNKIGTRVFIWVDYTMKNFRDRSVEEEIITIFSFP